MRRISHRHERGILSYAFFKSTKAIVRVIPYSLHFSIACWTQNISSIAPRFLRKPACYSRRKVSAIVFIRSLIIFVSILLVKCNSAIVVGVKSDLQIGTKILFRQFVGISSFLQIDTGALVREAIPAESGGLLWNIPTGQNPVLPNPMGLGGVFLQRAMVFNHSRRLRAQ